MRTLSVLVITLMLTLSGAANASAMADDNDVNPAAAAADAIIVRPVLLGVSLATTALYLATSPLTFLTDVDEEAGEVLVSWPWWFTSGRDVGRFDQPRPE